MMSLQSAFRRDPYSWLIFQISGLGNANDDIFVQMFDVIASARGGSISAAHAILYDFASDGFDG